MFECVKTENTFQPNAIAAQQKFGGGAVLQKSGSGSTLISNKVLALEKILWYLAPTSKP